MLWGFGGVKRRGETPEKMAPATQGAKSKAGRAAWEGGASALQCKELCVRHDRSTVMLLHALTVFVFDMAAA